LDVLLVRRGLASSREKGQALIMAGQVLVDDSPATKAGRYVSTNASIRVREGLRYVSRGGLKLEAALDSFGFDPAGLVAVDIGASTGGFTDCLLQRQAAHVFAVDVGYGQLAWSLRQDPRVTVLERTNARTLQELPGDTKVDLAVVDVSFISLTLVLPAVSRLLKPRGSAIILIKPQFEAGRQQVGKGGVVRDRRVHREILLSVLGWAVEHGWVVQALMPSPITGPKGNVEFLGWLTRGTPVGAGNLNRFVETTLGMINESS
jgi:23S rRNA (cytidine1920-2'-O)/16S rRNA (cytidine1409-2'-O)-methyltransferase